MDPNLCFEYQQLMSLYSHNKKSVTDKQQKQLELKKNDSKRQEKQQTKKENVSKVFENNNLNVEEVSAHVEVTKNQSNTTHNLEKSKQQHKLNLSNLFKNQKPKSTPAVAPVAVAPAVAAVEEVEEVVAVAPVAEVVAVGAPKAVAPVKINLFKTLQQIKLRK